MKSSSTHLIFAGSACVIALISYGFWYAAIAAKGSAVTALESQIDAKTATASRMATTRAALAEIAGDEAVVQSYFVPETGVVAFINRLEAQGSSLGATVSVLSVSNSVSGQSALTFALSITGTFDAVMRTVGAIEYAPYALSISTLSVSQDTKNKWHADLTVHVSSVSAGTATSTP